MRGAAWLQSEAAPDRPVYVTTYLKTAETGGYVPLARDVDLRTIVPGRDVTAEIPKQLAKRAIPAFHESGLGQPVQVSGEELLVGQPGPLEGHGDREDRGVAYVLRGPAKVQEASAAVGTPLDRGA